MSRLVKHRSGQPIPPLGWRPDRSRFGGRFPLWQRVGTNLGWRILHFATSRRPRFLPPEEPVRIIPFFGLVEVEAGEPTLFLGAGGLGEPVQEGGVTRRAQAGHQAR